MNGEMEICRDKKQNKTQNKTDIASNSKDNTWNASNCTTDFKIKKLQKPEIFSTKLYGYIIISL